MILKVIVFFLISTISYVNAQENPRSLYFSQKHPLSKKVKNKDQYLGTFADTTSRNANWVITEEGIFTENLLPLLVPKKKVRENSEYSVKNGYLFGVKKGDSLAYMVQDSNYLVGIPQRTLMANWDNNKGQAKIYQNPSGALYLHYKVEDYFSISKLSMEGNFLKVEELNYEDDMEKMLKLKNSSTTNFQNQKTLLIDPTKREWRRNNFEKLFQTDYRYIRQ